MAVVAGVLGRVTELLGRAASDQVGAVWNLADEGRQLDANIIRLAAGSQVERHVEPDLDVLLYVVAGDGQLHPDSGAEELAAGAVTWLPRGSGRALTAGADGLVYLTVHRRRQGMSIGNARSTSAAPRTPAAATDAQGGEAACLLNQVCAECGRMSPERTARFCGGCGAPLPRA